MAADIGYICRSALRARPDREVFRTGPEEGATPDGTARIRPDRADLIDLPDETDRSERDLEEQMVQPMNTSCAPVVDPAADGTGDCGTGGADGGGNRGIACAGVGTAVGTAAGTAAGTDPPGGPIGVIGDVGSPAGAGGGARAI